MDFKLLTTKHDSSFIVFIIDIYVYIQYIYILR